MPVILHFLRVMISWQTVIVISIACIATYLCLHFDVVLDLPTALIGIAIVFPIVFSINAAYRRREEALGYFASLKASAVSLFYAHRDWIPEESREHSPRMKELIERLLHSIHLCLTSRNITTDYFKQVYGVFSEISTSIEKLRDAGVTSTEVSRGNQYLRAMIFDFERMRNIHLYRTPTALRAYSYVFLNAFPILFAPYFAKLSVDHYYVAGFLVAAFYSLVLVGLDNIQEDLEHPYDQVGEDDLNLDVTELYGEILTQ